MKYRKNRRKRSYLVKGIVLATVFVIVLGFLITGSSFNALSNLKKTQSDPMNVKKTNSMIGRQDINYRSDDVDLGDIYSSSAILMNITSGEVMTSLNSAGRIYPASMTKIMTVLIAAEHIENWSDSITMTQQIRDELFIRNASVAGLEPGESLPLKDYLYGTLLPSGGDCALALAQYIAGSEEGFVNLMNQKASELGMTNSHFTNATGLHDPQHYITADDLVLLLAYALNNETFKDVFTTLQYTTSSTQWHPEGITFVSTLLGNEIIQELANGSIIGGKTGYTSEAGQCLASLAQINGERYLLITAGAEKPSGDETPYHILDALNIYSQIQ